MEECFDYMEEVGDNHDADTFEMYCCPDPEDASFVPGNKDPEYDDDDKDITGTYFDDDTEETDTQPDIRMNKEIGYQLSKSIAN